MILLTTLALAAPPDDPEFTRLAWDPVELRELLPGLCVMRVRIHDEAIHEIAVIDCEDYSLEAAARELLEQAEATGYDGDYVVQFEPWYETPLAFRPRLTETAIRHDKVVRVVGRDGRERLHATDDFNALPGFAPWLPGARWLHDWEPPGIGGQHMPPVLGACEVRLSIDDRGQGSGHEAQGCGPLRSAMSERALQGVNYQPMLVRSQRSAAEVLAVPHGTYWTLHPAEPWRPDTDTRHWVHWREVRRIGRRGKLEFPEEAIEEQISGECPTGIYIDAEGLAEKVIIQPGCEDFFQEALLEAVWSSRFRPWRPAPDAPAEPVYIHAVFSWHFYRGWL